MSHRSAIAAAKAPPGRPPDPDVLMAGLSEMLTALVQRAPLFRDLRGQGLAEDLVQDTLIAVTRRMRDGDTIEDPYAYAARCVTNLAKRTYLRAPQETATSDETLERLAIPELDVADRVAQRMTMAEVLDMVRAVNAVLGTLDDTDVELIRAELTRADQKRLAARLGISRPTLYRRKARAIKAFVAAVAQQAGTDPCSEHAGALVAAAGDSGFDAARAAVDHAAGCPGCGETLRHLAVARHGLAVTAPVPLVAAQTDPAGAFDRAWAATQTLVDTARAIVMRTGDPTPLTGSAAKVAVVAAACTGGGGVYCAVEGIPAALRPSFVHAEASSAHAKTTTSGGAATARPVRPAARAVTQINGTVRVVKEREATAARRREQARARKRAAARQRPTQTGSEFGAPRSSPPATGEFGSPKSSGEFGSPTSSGSPGSSTTQREFGAPSSGATSSTPPPRSTGEQEFGAP